MTQVQIIEHVNYSIELPFSMNMNYKMHFNIALLTHWTVRATQRYDKSIMKIEIFINSKKNWKNPDQTHTKIICFPHTIVWNHENITNGIENVVTRLHYRELPEPQKI